ncbi:MAG TPA: YCF48-related protein, partial [Gemmataceae bacterium]
MMRSRGFYALLLCALGGLARASDLRPLEDAPLHAVQFVDKQEGWAAGADGVVWHSIDGGKHWERQPTGTRAALRAVHFLNPYTGWAVGREELPHAGGSAGVILFTDDGGLKWSRLPSPPLPGLNCVRFFDDRTGLVAGDGSDLFPSGLFATNDGGRSWHPAPGPRCPGWLACDFRDPQTGVMAGAWGRLATLRDGMFNPADVDKLGGRGVRAVRAQGRRAVAAGQGGLVLLSQDSGGDRWGFADLRLAPEVMAGCDFDAVALVDQHIWVAGRPGSVVFHSPDFGRTWEALPTGQPLPLHALHFHDAQTGWAVGELGTVLATTDGGHTWTAQRRGGQRAAVLFVHARPDRATLETVAALGAEEGYLTAAVRVAAADPATADFKHAADPARWIAAQRRAGGAAGDCLGFPLPEHFGDADRAELAAAWDRSPSQLVRQLALLIRTWQPEVVVTDYAASAAPEALVADAVRAAFDRAADAQAFPEQLHVFHLGPWQVKKLYGVWEGTGLVPTVVRAAEPRRRIADTPRDYAAPAAALLADQPTELPAQRSYRLLASVLPSSEGSGDLMAGVALAAGGAARRPLPAEDVDPDRLAETEKALRERRNLQVLSQPDWGKLSDSGALLAQIAPALAKLPPEQGATAAFAIASRYAQAGQWHLAREAFLLMVDRYPTHPLAADAYRWLVAFHSSSEARRREELGQFLILTTTDIHQAAHTTTRDDPVTAGIRRVDARGLSETELRH